MNICKSVGEQASDIGTASKLGVAAIASGIIPIIVFDWGSNNILATVAVQEVPGRDLTVRKGQAKDPGVETSLIFPSDGSAAPAA